MRLLYNDGLLNELEHNMHRLGELKALHFHRAIDNEPLTIDADNLWIHLNYHLMHFVDFVPAANWSTHRADPLLQMFERLSSSLDRAGQRQAQVEIVFPATKTAPVGENRSLFGRISDALPPPAVKLTLARKTIQKYFGLAGHATRVEGLTRPPLSPGKRGGRGGCTHAASLEKRLLRLRNLACCPMASLSVAHRPHIHRTQSGE